ncbi:MAG: hypothetical protein CL897_01745 [Dehalococcoidia bacterium]|nr:hypothetical protein [Dehalococcoidia bacterium]|tara:strand:- start:1467 stop:2225 length:759 start_codon:yes stop_codon:yes gene_type:complete
MPPITLHMVLARRLAGDLPKDSLPVEAGPYLLGATAPDIRILTKADRRTTHFFDLTVFDHQDSVAGFFNAYGRLADPSLLNEETRAFVAGYLTHLVLDEQYITRIYRRFFYPHDVMGGALRANVMDRLLQFDLERVHGDPELRAHLCEALACTVDTIDAGFVDSETLERWRKVACDIAARGMDWDRARGMIENHLRRSGVEDREGGLAGFLDSLPELLDETIDHVTSVEVDAFIERSTDVAAAVVTRYLECG